MQFTYATARSLVSASVAAKRLSTTIPKKASNDEDGVAKWLEQHK